MWLELIRLHTGGAAKIVSRQHKEGEQRCPVWSAMSALLGLA